MGNVGSGIGKFKVALYAVLLAVVTAWADLVTLGVLDGDIRVKRKKGHACLDFARLASTAARSGLFM